MLNRIQFYISRGVFTVKNNICTHQELNSQPCHTSHMTKNSQYPTAPCCLVGYGKFSTLYGSFSLPPSQTSVGICRRSIWRQQRPTFSCSSTIIIHDADQPPPPTTHAMATIAHYTRRPPTTSASRGHTSRTTSQCHVTNTTSTGEVDAMQGRVVRR